jgi:cyclophilin family peptidyl-prolyl cis-trans isomerase
MILASLRRLAPLGGLVVALVACSPAGTAEAPVGGTGCPTAQPAALAAGETRDVTIATQPGKIVIRVEADLSPIAAGNFVALAACGWYDNVVFHRVLPRFVIQSGDGVNGRAPDVDRSRVGSGGPGYTIADEPVVARYQRGVVAMARTAKPDSAGSQFFIILDDGAAQSLEVANTYQIIGSVTSGMDVADAIAAAADAQLPTDPVVMTDVSVSTP